MEVYHIEGMVIIYSSDKLHCDYFPIANEVKFFLLVVPVSGKTYYYLESLLQSLALCTEAY